MKSLNVVCQGVQLVPFSLFCPWPAKLLCLSLANQRRSRLTLAKSLIIGQTHPPSIHRLSLFHPARVTWTVGVQTSWPKSVKRKLWTGHQSITGQTLLTHTLAYSIWSGRDLNVTEQWPWFSSQTYQMTQDPGAFRSLQFSVFSRPTASFLRPCGCNSCVFRVESLHRAARAEPKQKQRTEQLSC